MGVTIYCTCTLHVLYVHDQWILSSLYVAPASPPTNLKVSFITSTRAQVNWEPPPDTDQNGDITSYTLLLINTETNQITFLSTSVTFYTLTSLSPYTVYSIAVSASTSAGMGPFTIYTIFQTMEDGNL